MATTISLTFVLPDADVPDVVSALRRRYVTGAVPNPTQPQVVESLRQEVMQMVVACTKQYRADQLAAVAVAPVAT